MSENEVTELALSLMQNPDPFLRLGTDGKIILENPAAEKLTEFYYQGNLYKADDFWRFIAKKSDYILHGSVLEVNSDKKTYSFVYKYFPLSDYFNVYGRDITLQKKREAELYRLSLLSETNESGVLYNNAEGEILWVNEAFCKLIGYTAPEIIGRKSLDFCMGPLTDINHIKKIAASIGKAESFNVELIHYRKDGSWFWGRVKGKAFRTAESRELQYFAVIEDITLEKDKEERLEVLSKIAQSNLNSVIITDKRGCITWVNSSFTEMTGYSLEEAAGKKPGGLLQGPGTNPQAIEYLRTKVNEGKSFNTEIYNYAKDGTPYWLRIQGQPFFTAGNELSGFFAIQQNITNEKAIEDTLRANEEKYRSIITNMKLGLLEVDNDEKITYANKSFCEMSNYSLLELMGKKAGTLLTNGKSARLIEEKLAKRKAGLADAYELNAFDKNGNPKWWLVSAAPRYNDMGELVGSIGIHLDITEQKKLEGDLIGARVNAEQLARTKEIFLANMSHEIRTPMNAIMGMSSQLAKTTLAPQQQFYLDIIHSASENLLVIINDILDLSKIEAGKLSLEIIGFQPKAIIARSMRVLVHKAEEKGIKLTNSYFDKNISPVLLGDPHRLSQVLLNLMSNSIKFTDTGTVDLIFNLLQDKPQSQLIKVIVKDTGIGMEESFIANIFDKFSQEYESVTRTYGGTGLGMSICKDLIALMGGDINVESKKGVGTAISFSLELKKGSFADLPKKEIFQADDDFLAGKSILIADDNEMNRLVASIFVENYGANVIHAGNGRQAVDEFIAQTPDVILMDIQMPVMNGFEATKIIRRISAGVAIIALTANAIKGENEKCLAAGMNDYVSKPFKEEELLKIIAKWLGKEMNVSTTEKVIKEQPPEALYDLTSLRDISRGNEAFVEKMVNLFCDQTPGMLREMTIAYYDNNLEKMGAIAHKIKPSIDNLNIGPLKPVIRAIEKMGYEKIASPDLPETLLEIGTILERVIAKMKEEYQIQQT